MRLSAFIILFVVAVIVLGYLALNRAPDMLANNLAKKFGVSVSIDAMKFRPTKIEIDKFEIGNPRGYSLPKAFSAQDLDVQAPLTTYFKDDIVIDEIDVQDIYLGLEFDSTSSAKGNWSQILSHLEKDANLDKDTKPSVTIKRLVFRNIQTELLFKGEGNKVKKLPTIQKIELKNISTKGGFPTNQIMGSVLGQMVKEVFIQQNLQNTLKGLLFDTPGKALDDFLQPFDGLLNMNAPEQKEVSA